MKTATHKSASSSTPVGVGITFVSKISMLSILSMVSKLSIPSILSKLSCQLLASMPSIRSISSTIERELACPSRQTSIPMVASVIHGIVDILDSRNPNPSLIRRY